MIHAIKNRIEFYPIRKFDKIDGFLKPIEALNLYKIARAFRNLSKVVEIGSWKGKSTNCIAKGLKNGKVYAIDPFDASGELGSKETYTKQKGEAALRNQFISNMSSTGVIDKVEILQGYSSDFVDVDQVKEISSLFIDGDHSKEGTIYDYENYESKILSGGYIAFHDYYPDRTELGPTWVIDQLIKPSGKYKEIGVFGNLWVGRKN